MAWHSLSNIAYLCGVDATGFMSELIDFTEIPSCGTESARFALEIGMSDFEDALQVATADSFGLQLIATRNIKHFAKSPIKAMSPKSILGLLGE